MRTPPTKQYNGISIIIDKPSRFDLKNNRLLSGQPYQWFEDEIFNGTTLDHCDIYDLTEKYVPRIGTKRILLLGDRAAQKFNYDTARHGYPASVLSIPATVAFYPQDCCDHRNIEWADEDDDTEDTMSDRDIKDTASTRRSNYRFWTKWHIRKALYTSIPTPPKPNIITYPNLDTAYQKLYNITNEDLYLDIETSRIHRCLTTIGISTTSIWPTIYVFPIYLFGGNRAYTNWVSLYRLIYTLMRRNQVVIHNASFDLFVLRAYYKFPFPSRVYCTLLANHRCFPEIEKSLAHVIAQWTNLLYHKDVNTEVFNSQQQHKMWDYNGRDVYALKLIKDAQLNHASTRPGLLDSINQANSMIVPYLENSMLGLNINLSLLAKTHNELITSQNVHGRICALLSGKPTFNPGSNKQCREYFHDRLNYPVIARSEKPPFNSKLGKKQLYQLLIKTKNPLIKAILKYRKTAKDASMLECELWTPE